MRFRRIGTYAKPFQWNECAPYFLECKFAASHATPNYGVVQTDCVEHIGLGPDNLYCEFFVCYTLKHSILWSRSLENEIRLHARKRWENI